MYSFGWYRPAWRVTQVGAPIPIPPGYMQAVMQTPTIRPPTIQPPAMVPEEQGVTTGQALIVGSILAVGIALVTKGLRWW